MAYNEAHIGEAVTWIGEQLKDDPAADGLTLIGQAAIKFDLSPLQEDFLIDRLRELRAAGAKKMAGTRGTDSKDSMEDQ